MASANRGVYTFLVSPVRYSLWLKALKIRYWLDFGSSKDFEVVWHNVNVDAGFLIEHIVKVGCSESNECDELSSTQLLYTIQSGR